MLTLYADLMGLSGTERYKQAYRDILEKCGSLGPRILQKAVSSPASTSLSPGTALASLEQRDQVYRAMLELLSLKKKHKADLRKRGLTDEQICRLEQMGFKSTESGNTEAIARRLLSAGYRLEGVPGFYINGRNNWDLKFHKYNQGLLCPAPLEDQIQAFQIRCDIVRRDQKYIWLTSAGERKGVSSGSPVAYFGDPLASRAELTEGYLKGAISHVVSNESYFAVGGVNQCRNLKPALTLYMRKNLVKIGEAMDMDKYKDVTCRNDLGSKCLKCKGETADGSCIRKEETRAQIRRGCINVYQICRELHLDVVSHVWDRDENGLWKGNIKGIDNYWIDKQEKGAAA